MIKGIIGAHLLLYTSDPEADRAFFRDVLELRSVDAGRGWLIFAMPPSEAALHPVEAPEQAPPGDLLRADLYLMCDDVRALVRLLESRHVPCSAIAPSATWGRRNTCRRRPIARMRRCPSRRRCAPCPPSISSRTSPKCPCLLRGLSPFDSAREQPHFLIPHIS